MARGKKKNSNKKKSNSNKKRSREEEEEEEEEVEQEEQEEQEEVEEQLSYATHQQFDEAETPQQIIEVVVTHADLAPRLAELSLSDLRAVLLDARVRELVNHCPPSPDGHVELALWRTIFRDAHKHAPRHRRLFSNGDETVVERCEVLLEAGADPWLYDMGSNPLTWCVRYGTYHVLTKKGTLKSCRAYFRGAPRWEQLVALLDRYRAIWEPALHARFPAAFDDVVVYLLWLNKRYFRLPKDVLFLIFKRLAADVAISKRDPVSELVLDQSTNYHLLHMCRERELGYFHYRTDRDRLVKVLKRHAEQYGPE